VNRIVARALAAWTAAMLVGGCGAVVSPSTTSDASVAPHDASVAPDDAKSREAGSDTAPTSHDAPSSDVASPDAVVSGGCPATLPGAGLACLQSGLECEYGSDPEVTCDSVAICTSGGWRVEAPTAVPVCGTSNPAACPSSYSAVEGTTTCETVAMQAGSMAAANGIRCYYPEARCTCTTSCVVGLCGTSGADSGPAPATWYCDIPAPASPNCPVPRPRLGTPCSTIVASCDYASCEGGIALACTPDGIWQMSENPPGCD
jgi:hypothetical protein